MEIKLADGMTFDSELIEQEKWQSYLYYTEYRGVNIERVETVEQVSGKETLSYVLRTLKILDQDLADGRLNKEEYKIIQTVLQWSEVSKGGNVRERESWRKKGYALDIHNLASADIYREECALIRKDNEAALNAQGFTEGTQIESFHSVEKFNMIYLLIRTHGLIGQALRGEVPVECNKQLEELKKKLKSEDLYRLDRKRHV